MKRYAPRRQRRRFHRLLTFLAVLAFHAAWFSMPVTFLERSEKIPEQDGTLQVLPADGSRAWTPVLFALPSLTGFSKALMARDSEFSRNLGEPLDLSVTDALRAQGASRPNLRCPSPVPQTPFPLSSLRAREPTPARPQPRWKIWWRNGVGPKLVVFRSPAHVPRGGDAPSVDGVISFDVYGMVHQVELDRPQELQPRARQSILQTLSTMRVAQENGNVRLPFRLAYTGGSGR